MAIEARHVQNGEGEGNPQRDADHQPKKGHVARIVEQSGHFALRGKRLDDSL
jgi:hypothetical protein